MSNEIKMMTFLKVFWEEPTSCYDQRWNVTKYFLHHCILNKFCYDKLVTNKQSVSNN